MVKNMTDIDIFCNKFLLFLYHDVRVGWKIINFVNSEKYEDVL
jgi:hypothetical protein